MRKNVANSNKIQPKTLSSEFKDYEAVWAFLEDAGFKLISKEKRLYANGTQRAVACHYREQPPYQQYVKRYVGIHHWFVKCEDKNLRLVKG